MEYVGVHLARSQESENNKHLHLRGRAKSATNDDVFLNNKYLVVGELCELN